MSKRSPNPGNLIDSFLYTVDADGNGWQIKINEVVVSGNPGTLVGIKGTAEVVHRITTDGMCATFERAYERVRQNMNALPDKMPDG